jgi:hypothetical protein
LWTKEKAIMDEQEEKKEEEQVEKKKKKEEELPFCTTAPSAEHSRSDEEDEPCDDFREGE